MRTWSKYIIGSLIVIGSCIGGIWIPTLLNISQDSGILLGIGLGFLISFFIPNVWKSFLETIRIEHEEAIEQKSYISFTEVLKHPIHLPVTLGGIWFILIIVATRILEIDVSQKLPSIIGFTPMFLSIGISGLEMLKRKELIIGGWFGYYIKKSKWAIILGCSAMIFGFGLSIIYTMAVIYDL